MLQRIGGIHRVLGVHRSSLKMSSTHIVFMYGTTIAITLTFVVAAAMWVIFARDYSR